MNVNNVSGVGNAPNLSSTPTPPLKILSNMWNTFMENYNSSVYAGELNKNVVLGAIDPMVNMFHVIGFNPSLSILGGGGGIAPSLLFQQ